ncbi:MAG: ISAzo13 family transposase [Halobacteriales archaeon]|nr:ISAzo13 family transposase [Halobacteriales archaeon]
MDAGQLRLKLEKLRPFLDERAWRLTLAAEAVALGHGGIAVVHEASGASRSTISRGIAELESEAGLQDGRIRKGGGGRKALKDEDPTLVPDLEALVDPGTRGDPESRLRWTTKSLRNLQGELKAKGHRVSHVVVGELLKELGYSLQGNRKTLEGTSHPDRNAQFEHINKSVVSHQKKNEPVISVDTKKKELVGRFRNAGKAWRPQGKPEEVKVHDFVTEDGKAIPYGVYDVTRNKGWVSVGITHDTAEFAVATIARWWRMLGKKAYPRTKAVYITADAGGSNGSRLRLWKWELQHFANRTGLTIHVSHFPPGTSKWNKIEHRLFSFITQNWKGEPLVSVATIIDLIAATKTDTGLDVHCELDKREYEKGRKVTDAEMATINLRPDRFHGDWNYSIAPKPR